MPEVTNITKLGSSKQNRVAIKKSAVGRFRWTSGYRRFSSHHGDFCPSSVRTCRRRSIEPHGRLFHKTSVGLQCSSMQVYLHENVDPFFPNDRTAIQKFYRGEKKRSERSKSISSFCFFASLWKMTPIKKHELVVRRPIQVTQKAENNSHHHFPNFFSSLTFPMALLPFVKKESVF